MKQDGLKNKLKCMERSDLLSLLIDIAGLRKENREWLEIKLKDDTEIEESLRYFKGKIRGCIFNSGKPNLSEARRFILNFKRISADEKYVIDLMLFYVETGDKLSEEYGDLYEQFYTSMENMFISVIGLLREPRNAGLKNEFMPRLKWIVDHAAEGWGYKDTLEEHLGEL